jgi:hypothetical protein
MKIILNLKIWKNSTHIILLIKVILFLTSSFHFNINITNLRSIKSATLKII